MIGHSKLADWDLIMQATQAVVSSTRSSRLRKKKGKAVKVLGSIPYRQYWYKHVKAMFLSSIAKCKANGECLGLQTQIPQLHVGGCLFLINSTYLYTET